MSKNADEASSSSSSSSQPPSTDFPSNLIEEIEERLLSGGHPIHGEDATGDIFYGSILEMWNSVLSSKDHKEVWYGHASDYWEDDATCPATVNGMLGGFASISAKDLEGSKEFLQELMELRPGLQPSGKASCECGAGIGRVTKGLLLPMGCAPCDLVEASSRFLRAAPEYIGDPGASKCRYLCVGLQEFEPKPGRYMIVWIQWVIGYLTDVDCIKFLKRCGESLCEGGVIVLKDNTCDDKAFVLDDDSSLTRSLPYLMELAKRAGLRVVHQKKQDDFPEDIFPVPMVAFEVDR